MNFNHTYLLLIEKGNNEDSDEYDEDPTYDNLELPGNKKNNRNARYSPVHPEHGNSKFTEIIENPYYGTEDTGGNENTITVKKVDNPYYNEAEWSVN